MIGCSTTTVNREKEKKRRITCPLMSNHIKTTVSVIDREEKKE